MDYGANCLHIPLHADMKMFEVRYHQPMKTIPKIDGGSIAAHKAALKALSIMIGLLTVMSVLDNHSPII